MFSVYVLCSKTTGRLYTGSTSNLSIRIEQHNSDATRSTKHRGPWELIHHKEYASRAQAVVRERELKTGKGRDEVKRIVTAGKRSG
ncbi:MAG TPA: GIY-YIG nuclease family protein [Candidatus Dormibacteraeota bacterium]|nr:GIY-YIG nuclease family protein [Candidatus Dormibacteraeota bacterium]